MHVVLFYLLLRRLKARLNKHATNPLQDIPVLLLCISYSIHAAELRCRFVFLKYSAMILLCSNLERYTGMLPIPENAPAYYPINKKSTDTCPFCLFLLHASGYYVTPFQDCTGMLRKYSTYCTGDMQLFYLRGADIFPFYFIFAF